MMLRWEDGFFLEIHIRRRRFPWPTDNVTFRRTIFTKHQRINNPTLRHEGTHCRQAVTIKWFYFRYVLSGTFRRSMEAEARAAETAAYPQWGPAL